MIESGAAPASAPAFARDGDAEISPPAGAGVQRVDEPGTLPVSVQPASQVEPKPAAPDPAAEQEQQQEQDPSAEADGVDHPLVRKAIELFNARVVGVQQRH